MGLLHLQTRFINNTMTFMIPRDLLTFAASLESEKALSLCSGSITMCQSKTVWFVHDSHMNQGHT